MQYLDALGDDQAMAIAGLALGFLALVTFVSFRIALRLYVNALLLYRRAAARERAAAAFLREYPDALRDVIGRVMMLEASERERQEQRTPLERLGLTRANAG